MFRPFVCIVLLLSALVVRAENSVTITDAWIAEAPPSSGVNAGYMRVENTGQTTVTLLSVESPAFPEIEIHQSTIENNIASMEQIRRIDIAPEQQLNFAPGDFHLMLYNTGKSPQSGETIQLMLQFADGTSISVQAGVRKMSESHQQHQQPSSSGSLTGYAVLYQHLLPQHFLSGLMYRLTRISWPPLKNLLIKSFISFYKVDMSIAVNSDPEHYQHFNEFFTRPLQASARPLDTAADAIISPVDGVVSQHGRINNGKLIQAKNRDYSVEELLGGDPELASRFNNGEFITLYLSPKDYHRIHMPVSGMLQSMTYIPGKLFSVNPATTRTIDNLFARNERVVTVYKTDIGNVALIMVGAIFVGSMETTWAGQITPAGSRQPTTRNHPEAGQTVQFEKGDEMGRFNMGSTVILLFEQNRLDWDASVYAEQGVQLGKRIARLK